MTLLEQLGAYVAEGGRDSLSPPVRELMRLHVADSIAAWAAGSLSPEGRALTDFHAQGASRDSGLEQILLRCAVTRLSEIDDIHLASTTTPGAVIVPAALTLAAAHGAPRGALAEAILVGYEVMVRLGLALDGPTILYRGIWPTYVTAPFAVAAVASRLLGLSGRQASHALALALSLASPGVGQQGGPNISRWLALGHAGRSGALAALAARFGFTADLGLLEGEFFPSVYSIRPDLARLSKDLGNTSVLGEVSFKPWCAAKQTMAASQALKEIVSEGVAPGDITGVEVFVPPPTLRMVNHGVVAGDRASYLTSAPYQLAAGVFSPDEQFRLTPSAAQVPESIRSFIAKVTVKADEALLRHFPKAWPARVVVRIGPNTREKLLLAVPGDPGLPMDETQVSGKFARVLSPLLGEAGARRLASEAFSALDPDGTATDLVAKIEHAASSRS